MEPQIIATIEGGAQFHSGARIASGTFCKVYEAEDRHIIKTFSSRRQHARTINVARALAPLAEHRGRAHIEEAIDATTTLAPASDAMDTADAAKVARIPRCIVMPRYCVQLNDFLSDYVRDKKSGLPAVATIAIARQLFHALDALERAHVVHGDIKPSNIMFREPPTFDVHGVHSLDIVLCDFGSARIANTETHLCAPANVGTFAYIAPEILLGCEYSYPADVWSAMVTLFDIITGDPLFDIFGTEDFAYGVDFTGIYVEDEDDDSSDSSDDDESRLDEEMPPDDDVGVDFPTMYAHLAIMYCVIGKPPRAFRELASEFYVNDTLRYTPELQAGTISRFLNANYTQLSMRHMMQIEQFLSLGLQYLAGDRTPALAVLNHPFLA